MTKPSTIAIIPARGGSKGIPRKNIRFLHGKPLIFHTIETALKCRLIDKVIVSTDDEEIGHAAEVTGCAVVMRPVHLAADDVPLDPVIHHAISAIEQQGKNRYDVVITMQPTSPLLSFRSVDRALERFFDSSADTLISVVDDRHLSWTMKGGKYVPLYEKRVNRQYLPANYRETGGFVITRRQHVTNTSRFGPDIDLFVVSNTEAVDIDSYMDWWLADKLLGRKRILFRTDGYREIGLGHIYRSLMLASKLIDHDLLLVAKKQHTLGAQKIAGSFYRYRLFENETEFKEILTEFNPHIVINDILDTDAQYINDLKDNGRFVVNFEDLGGGAARADLVINALYEGKHTADNYYFGKDYYCLRDEFLLLEPRATGEQINEVLITFGGADSSNYTRRVLFVLSRLPSVGFKITVVTGLGYRDLDSLKSQIESLNINIELLADIRTISKYMRRADLVFTSAGRTVFEVASLGTPIIVMAQNERELSHTFAREDNGIVNLGLGHEVSDEEIERAFSKLAGDAALRRKYSRIMLGHNLRQGMDNVLKLIFEKFEKHDRQMEK